ncbi:hypothetical protein DCC81_10420 [Chitinophaga parva]|uniref:Uncharacterized protein n=1 Tax=Chitinophaga parva TaxID=2169414 RepID=A0A2T7BEN5_9BACT|nr:hypothetical protein [Chitinophaga parva]PUZ24747.1 hypothetical protein DCC81_10420 [Chitinophaga parva]
MNLSKLFSLLALFVVGAFCSAGAQIITPKGEGGYYFNYGETPLHDPLQIVTDENSYTIVTVPGTADAAMHPEYYVVTVGVGFPTTVPLNLTSMVTHNENDDTIVEYTGTCGSSFVYILLRRYHATLDVSLQIEFSQEPGHPGN